MVARLGLLIISLVCINHRSGFAQSPAFLNAVEIKRLLPEKIMNGYARGESGNAKVMKIGNLQYSMAEISYVNGRKQIKVMLFDYAAASIMYEQSVKKFKAFEPVSNDSLFIQPLQINQGNGWQVAKPVSKSAQVALGIFNRFPH